MSLISEPRGGHIGSPFFMPSCEVDSNVAGLSEVFDLFLDLSVLRKGALGTLSEIMGAAKIFGPDRQIFDCSPEDIALAMDEGFRIFAQGCDAVIALLMDLRTRPGEPQLGPQGRYGPVYEWLKRGAGAAPEFEPMKTLLREHILESWPLDAGTDVLGHRLEKLSRAVTNWAIRAA